MQMRKLGSQGPEISVIGYGAWEAGGVQWGPGSEEESRAAIRAALDAGMNWVDTAEAYGDGRSEELVGEVVRDRRDEVLIFTKVAHFTSGLRPEDVKRAIRASLRRLGTDHVDLYQIHWPDPEEQTRLEDTWGTMAELVDEGLVRYLGVSNFQRDLIERCATIRHVDSVQNHFSLLYQPDRDELLPWLQEQGVGYLAYGPLTYGLLTGAIDENTTFPEDDWRSGTLNVGYYEMFFAPDVRGRHVERVNKLRPVAERLGISLATLALAGAAATPGVSGVIAGSRNARHVESNAAAGDLQIDEVTMGEIDSIMRGG